MEYKPKFNIGQFVYRIKKRKKMVINRIDARFNIEDNQIHYYYGSTDDSILYRESNLTADRPEPKTVYDLDCGDMYYVVCSSGIVISRVFNDWDIEKKYINSGNAFIKKDEALKEAKRRKIHQTLRKLAGEYKPMTGKCTCNISYDTSRKKVFLQWTYYENEPYIVYFRDKLSANNAIEKIGEETLIRDYFGIEV